ncbi:MAG: hypothetical protein DRN29_00215 [Thermoplasmata archaeon]|nr:MAG: hypothetical protein DRN29_00215 [Thermoplasmata archaeon]
MKIDLKVRPIRQIDWIEEEGRVSLKVIKFKGKFGQWLCRALKKPNYFLINLDEVGSFIWKKCNGKNSIEDILKQLEEKYGKEKMKERLIVFLLMLKRYGYVEFER